MKVYQISLESGFKEADQTAVALTNHLQVHYGQRMTPEINFNINFVLRELLNNAVEHGNCFQEGRQVTCTLTYGEESIEMLVQDEGVGECRFKRPFQGLDPAPGAEENQVIREWNRGLWLVEQLGIKVHTQEKQCIAIYHWRDKA